jgi:hypothetical protein
VTLSGIPAGSTIVAAFANWSYLTDAPGDSDEALITINGNPVTGNVSAALPDLGWGKGNSASYTADVTGLVSGNGTFTIGGAIDEVTLTPPPPVTKAFGEGFFSPRRLQQSGIAAEQDSRLFGFHLEYFQSAGGTGNTSVSSL